MKKILLILAAGLFALTACQKTVKVEEHPIQVSQVFEQGDSLVGDTVLVEGYCMHLCKHGGKKAFLSGGVQGQFLRCNAVAFEAFAPESMNNTLRVKGVVRAFDVPTQEAAAKEEAEHHHTDGQACDACTMARHYYVDALEYTIVEE